MNVSGTTRRSVVGLFWCWLAGSSGAAAPPVLDSQHRHPSGSFTFRTPADWVVREVPQRPGAVEASGGPLRVRFVWQKGEQGSDAMHTLCIDERLYKTAEASLDVRYEYEMVGGAIGDRQLLDTAFVIQRLDKLPGERGPWHQRAVTIVGGGETLCVVAGGPDKEWKKARKLIEAILTSMEFVPQELPPPLPAQ